MTLEDSWGGDVITAAISHLAHSTPEEFRFTATDFNSYVTRDFADGAPRRRGGKLEASKAPGLGVEVRQDDLLVACTGRGAACKASSSVWHRPPPATGLAMSG